MPIYKQINSLADEVLETLSIDFHTEFKAKESIVAHFGYGDIHICSSKSRNSYSDEICLHPSREKHPIGEAGDPKDFNPLFPPIRLIFDKRESIEAFIAEMNVLLDGFPNTAPADSGEREDV